MTDDVFVWCFYLPLSPATSFLSPGTPYHNHLSEIWSLADLAVPGILGNFATFQQNFADYISAGSKKNSSDFEVLRKDKLSRELKNILSKYFLRRDKASVLEDEANLTTGAVNAAGGGKIGAAGTAGASASFPAASGAGPSAGGGAAASSSSAAETQLVVMSSSSDVEGPVPVMIAKKKQTLPPKRDIMLFLSLSKVQKELYRKFLTSDTVKEAKVSKKNGIETFKAIALLKKVCDHPLMCLPREPYHDDILTKWKNSDEEVKKGKKIPKNPAQTPNKSAAVVAGGAEQPGGAAASSAAGVVVPGAAASSSDAAAGVAAAAAAAAAAPGGTTIAAPTAAVSVSGAAGVAAKPKETVQVKTKVSPEEQEHEYGDVDEKSVEELKKLITPFGKDAVEQSCRRDEGRGPLLRRSSLRGSLHSSFLSIL